RSIERGGTDTSKCQAERKSRPAKTKAADKMVMRSFVLQNDSIFQDVKSTCRVADGSGHPNLVGSPGSGAAKQPAFRHPPDGRYSDSQRARRPVGFSASKRSAKFRLIA